MRGPILQNVSDLQRYTFVVCNNTDLSIYDDDDVVLLHRLVEEVFEIQETVDKLKAKLRESENALQHLLRTKSALEHDLNVKNNSLFIDRERCMGLRKTFPLAPRVACY